MLAMNLTSRFQLHSCNSNQRNPYSCVAYMYVIKQVLESLFIRALSQIDKILLCPLNSTNHNNCFKQLAVECWGVTAIHSTDDFTRQCWRCRPRKPTWCENFGIGLCHLCEFLSNFRLIWSRISRPQLKTVRCACLVRVSVVRFNLFYILNPFLSCNTIREYKDIHDQMD